MYTQTNDLTIWLHSRIYTMTAAWKFVQSSSWLSKNKILHMTYLLVVFELHIKPAGLDHPSLLGS